MTTEIGTATGHNDLLDKFHDFLLTCGWTEMQYTPGVLDTAVATIVMRAPGASSGNEYFWFAETAFNVGAGEYGWKMHAAIDYDSALTTENQTLLTPALYYNTWQNDIDYWFYGSGRRAIIVAKVNTSYVSMYAGLFLPFALPSQYTKPFYLAGNYPILAPYDVSNARNRFIVDPGDQTAYYLNKDVNTWLKVQNHDDSVAVVNFSASPNAFMWPHRSYRAIGGDIISTPISWNFNGMMNMRPLNSGEIPNFQAHILSGGERKAIGALDGVYTSPGFGKTSEQLLTYGVRDFRAFQNVFRTTARDFMAIEEI